MRTVRLIPLWSFASIAQWKQILLNVALFIPLGFYQAALFSRTRVALFTALSVSISVELIQFVTCRGILDIDDLISNIVGAAIGLMIFRTVGWRKAMAIILLCLGLTGCVITAVTHDRSTGDTIFAKQFYFKITEVQIHRGAIELTGRCAVYNRETPDYQILLGNTAAETTVDGERFTAATRAPEGKTELRIRFHGYPPILTGTWISGDRIAYVPGSCVEPEGVPATAVLKAYDAEYDVFIYQDGHRLLWLIGSEIDNNTEIIYHIYTMEPEKLTEKRVKYGFDNRGFRADREEKAKNELEGIGRYRVFEREIPQEYSITAVAVGFNTSGTVVWTQYFRLDSIDEGLWEFQQEGAQG